MVGRGGAGPAGSGWSVSTRTSRSEHPSRRALRGAVRPRRRLAFVGRGTGFRRGPRQGVPGHCLGRACFRWRREGAGWSGGGEAGAEPFPLEGPGEPSACWELGGGLLGRLGGEKSWGLQRSREGGGGGLRCPAPLPQLLRAVNSSPGLSYFSWTQESGPPGSQLPRQEWRQKIKASAPFQVMDPAVRVPSPLLPQTQES